MAIIPEKYHRPSVGQLRLSESHTKESLDVLVNESLLTPGGIYILSDFETKHLIPNTTEIHTGPVEGIILTALSESTFMEEAFSVEFPNDTLKFDYTQVLCEDGVTSRKGMITYRENTLMGQSADFDFRNFRNRRYAAASKLYQSVTKVDDTNVSVTVNSNVPGLNNRIRYEVSFAEMTHPSGEVNITFVYNNGTIVKPLRYHIENALVFPANYISNKKGTVIYNPSLDSFVFMAAYDIGASLVGDYVCPTISPYTIGHGGITLIPDTEIPDYIDYPVFPLTSKNIHVKANKGNLGSVTYYPNIVFQGQATDVSIKSFSDNCTFTGQLNNFHIGEGATHSIFEGNLTNFHVHKRTFSLLYLATGSSFGTMQHEYYMLEGVVMRPVLNVNCLSIFNTTVIVHPASNIRFSAVVSESNIFGTGINVGGTVPNNFYINAPVYRCLIGYLNTRSLNINKTINNQNIFTRNNISDAIGENILGFTQSDFIKIKEALPSPIGATQNIAVDEEGNVVAGTEGAGEIVTANDGVKKVGTVFSADETVIRVAGAQKITGPKDIQRAGPNTGVSAAKVLGYEIDTNNLYRLDLMNTQNVQAPDAEVQWFYKFTSNVGGGVARERDMLGFARGAVTVLGGRALPETYYGTIVSAENANSGNPSYRYPLRQYMYGVSQMEGGLVVGTDAVRVPQITGNVKVWSEGDVVLGASSNTRRYIGAGNIASKASISFNTDTGNLYMNTGTGGLVQFQKNGESFGAITENGLNTVKPGGEVGVGVWTGPTWRFGQFAIDSNATVTHYAEIEIGSTIFEVPCRLKV